MYRKSIATALLFSVLPAIALGHDTSPELSNLNSSTTRNLSMSRVTGIGGIFIKAKDPAKLRAWYKQHLGIDVQAWGGTSFRWVDSSGKPTPGTTAWMVGNGENFAPSRLLRNSFPAILS
jgi:hypothetical protein